MAADTGTCNRERKRQDRCPGVLRMHGAADGQLARIRVPGGRLSAAQLLALATAAELGNGIVELTSRANLQLRGLPQDAGVALAEILSKAGLFPSPAHDRVRNVIASPLAGRHPDSMADTDPVVQALDRGLCADPTLAELPGRFLFAVDDGSRLALGHGADVTLSACDASTFEVLIGGVAIRETRPDEQAVQLALALARAFLEERRSAGSMAWRIAELDDGVALLASRAGGELSTAQVPSGSGPLTIGRQAQRDGLLAVTALAPDGRLEPGALGKVARLADTHGLQVRVSPWRTLTVPDLSGPACADVEEGLTACGLLVAAIETDANGGHAVPQATVPVAGQRTTAHRRPSKQGQPGMIEYIRDGAEIYRRSFATIRSETDLDDLDPVLARTVVRMIHACGMTDLVTDVQASPGFSGAARNALLAGAPILCDTAMVASGVTRSRLPAENDVICTLSHPDIPELAARLQTTRTAAALEHWRERLEGSLVVIGNAPTALFRLLEMIEEGAPRPAAVIGVPVGFIGAAESKAELTKHPSRLEHLVVHGRRGGSAIAAGAVNALASETE